MYCRGSFSNSSPPLSCSSKISVSFCACWRPLPAATFSEITNSQVRIRRTVHVYVCDCIFREKGYEESLFKRLSSAHPTSLTSLTHQHRMNRYFLITSISIIFRIFRNIMELSNHLTYNNLLFCASEYLPEQPCRYQDGVLRRFNLIGWRMPLIQITMLFF